MVLRIAVSLPVRLFHHVTLLNCRPPIFVSQLTGEQTESRTKHGPQRSSQDESTRPLPRVTIRRMPRRKRKGTHKRDGRHRQESTSNLSRKEEQYDRNPEWGREDDKVYKESQQHHTQSLRFTTGTTARLVVTAGQQNPRPSTVKRLYQTHNNLDQHGHDRNAGRLHLPVLETSLLGASPTATIERPLGQLQYGHL